MYDDTLPDRCRICGDRIDSCLIPIGAHLLCTPNAECRHELCALNAGDQDGGFGCHINQTQNRQCSCLTD